MSASETGSAAESTRLLPDEYEGLIERVRETANAMIPRNATVLVVSRGDEELLRHRPPAARCTFPRTSSGATPATTRRTATLRSQSSRACARAAREYLLLPSTAFWWLDYYEGLRDHLERNYPPIVSADDCVVFELGATGVQTAAADADTKADVRRDVEQAARRAAGRAAPGAATRRRPHRRGHPGHLATSQLSGTAMPFSARRRPPA